MLRNSQVLQGIARNSSHHRNVHIARWKKALKIGRGNIPRGSVTGCYARKYHENTEELRKERLFGRSISCNFESILKSDLVFNFFELLDVLIGTPES